MNTQKNYKIPISVLVIIHDGCGFFLLLRRQDQDELWQSVTGSIETGEQLIETAQRELYEETGLCIPTNNICDWHQSNEYEIYPRWRHRYASGVTHNTEHIFSIIISKAEPIYINPREHIDYQWLPQQEAAQKVFSPSNCNAILQIPLSTR